MATTVAPKAAQIPFTLDMARVQRVVLRPGPEFTDDDFFDFCQRHDLLRIERNAEGEIIIMPTAGSEGNTIEVAVTVQLAVWAKRDERGVVLAIAGGVKLPDGSTMAPDACWVPNDRWNAVSRKLRKKFAPVVPLFVIEIRSETDRKKDLHEKMLAYLRNGVELGWFIDPIARKVTIYKPGQPPTELDDPPRLEGEGPVTGFVLDLKQIYDDLDE